MTKAHEVLDNQAPDKQAIDLKDVYSTPKGRGLSDEEDRQARLGALIDHLADKPELEDLAGLLIALREEIDGDPQGIQQAYDEMGHVLNLIFRRSEAYRLAFALYAGRYQTVGGAPALEEMLKLIVKQNAPAMIEDDEERAAIEREGDTEREEDASAEFARLCRELTGPLRRVMEHPQMDDDAARTITDGFIELYNMAQPGKSHADAAVDVLTMMADAGE
jgi:hypothetical protein